MRIPLLLSLLLNASVAWALELKVPMYFVSEKGLDKAIGYVIAEDTQYGLLLKPNLSGLEVGIYDFHVHENPSCEAGEVNGKIVPAFQAGGHYDPHNTKKHSHAYDPNGHLGDLPPLYADTKGNVSTPVLAPKIKAKDLLGRSLMIHAEHEGSHHHGHMGHHHHHMGKSGARMVCGAVVQE